MLLALGALTPVVNSKPVRHRDYSVELQRSGPAILPAMYHNMHLVAVVLGGQAVVMREKSSGRVSVGYAAGDGYLRGAGPAGRVTWPAGIHALYVHLHPRLIREVSEKTLGVPDLALPSRPFLRDPVVRDIAFQLHQSIAGGARVDLRLAHDLVLALAHHVTLKYAVGARPAPRIGALSVEAVLDAFRENTLSWPGVAALAAECGLSRSHFTRQVRSVAGVPPYRMVLGSRIETVKHLLERREASLSEIAYLSGFVDQSHLTRVFRRLTGLTPARYLAAKTERR